MVVNTGLMMRLLLIAALMTTSLSATAETYICTSEAIIFNTISYKEELKWETEHVNKSINIIFEKDSKIGAFKKISGELFDICALTSSENDEITYCSSMSRIFILNNVDKKYTQSALNFMITKASSIPYSTLQYGTCELFGVEE